MEKTHSIPFRSRFPVSGRRWFTLVELVVSITILSVVMLSVFTVYSNILQINKRLEVMRVVQENVRNITEQIAADIREKGIDTAYYDGSVLSKTNDYAGSGNLVLAIKWGDKYYPMKDGSGGPTLCSETDQSNPGVHCYIGKEDSAHQRKAVSDDRVHIDSVRFFLSGNSWWSIDNLSQEGKATIALAIGIENGVWVDSEMAKNARTFIQTTISEKAYKKNQ